MAKEGSSINFHRGEILFLIDLKRQQITGQMPGRRSHSTAEIASFVPDLPGTYVMQLIVNDGFADSAPATVEIEAVREEPRRRGAKEPRTKRRMLIPYSFMAGTRDPLRVAEPLCSSVMILIYI